MSDMYEVRLGLSVTGPDRVAHFDSVADAYADLERVDRRLLDSTFGLRDGDDEAEIDIEITVAASSDEEAHKLVTSCVRSAIQAAGGFTPDWADRRPAEWIAVYRVHSESVDRVLV